MKQHSFQDNKKYKMMKTAERDLKLHSKYYQLIACNDFIKKI